MRHKTARMAPAPVAGPRHGQAPLLVSKALFTLFATGLAASGMTDTPDNTQSPGQTLSARAEAARAERLARQAAALRANLRRRKDQARTRQDHTAQDQPRATTQTPGNGESKTCP